MTAFAGYVVILRGKTFSVGDRITMGKIRGDVIALGFFQTTIMEMGQPQDVEAQVDPAIWVRARQYTGRVVSVSNDHIFEQPVYNYTREFPFLWEEIRIPIKYGTDYRRVERILLDCARRVVEDIQSHVEPLRKTLERKYFIRVDEMGPRVYCRLTSNWIEIASTTFEVVGIPPVRLQATNGARSPHGGDGASRLTAEASSETGPSPR